MEDIMDESEVEDLTRIITSFHRNVTEHHPDKENIKSRSKQEHKRIKSAKDLDFINLAKACPIL